MTQQYGITRRRALGVLLGSLAVSACSFDSILAPKAEKRGFRLFVSKPEITLIGSGDAHAKTNLANATKTGRLAKSMLDQNPSARAFMVGDLAEHGLASEYDLYHSTWGQFKDRTDFQIGNCDLLTDPTGRLWYDYTHAGESGKFYYAKTYGLWRVYYLNSQTGLWAEQNQWLADDLPQWSNTHHIMAMWHQPMFASVCHHNGSAMTRPKKLGPWWDLLRQHGAELVCSGHAHRYERMARMLRDGTKSAAGIRQFVLGTGGPRPMAILTAHPNSQKQVIARGIMKFDLFADRYEWKFTDLSGVVRDSGVQLCRKVLV